MLSNNQLHACPAVHMVPHEKGILDLTPCQKYPKVSGYKRVERHYNAIYTHAFHNCATPKVCALRRIPRQFFTLGGVQRNSQLPFYETPASNVYIRVVELARPTAPLCITGKFYLLSPST